LRGCGQTGELGGVETSVVPAVDRVEQFDRRQRVQPGGPEIIIGPQIRVTDDGTGGLKDELQDPIRERVSIAARIGTRRHRGVTHQRSESLLVELPIGRHREVIDDEESGRNHVVREGAAQ
jgi:hypothetical protein